MKDRPSCNMLSSMLFSMITLGFFSLNVAPDGLCFSTSLAGLLFNDLSHFLL